MARNEDGARQKSFRVRTVRGEPYDVNGRTLTPTARVVSYGRARVTIGTDQVSGWGGGFAQITPLAVAEQTAEGEHSIAIHDATATALRGMLAGAVAMTLFLTAIRWLVRGMRK